MKPLGVILAKIDQVPTDMVTKNFETFRVCCAYGTTFGTGVTFFQAPLTYEKSLLQVLGIGFASRSKQAIYSVTRRFFIFSFENDIFLDEHFVL